MANEVQECICCFVDFFKIGCEFSVRILYELIEIVIEFSIVDIFEKGYLIGWMWIGSHAG